MCLDLLWTVLSIIAHFAYKEYKCSHNYSKKHTKNPFSIENTLKYTSLCRHCIISLMLLIFLYGFFAFVSLALGIRQTKKRKNPYGLTPQLIIYGIFVWGDAIIIGLFWTVVSLITVLTGNTSFFLITQAVYWIVRSMGENTRLSPVFSWRINLVCLPTILANSLGNFYN